MQTFPLLKEDTLFDGVILANGDYPTHPVPTSILQHARSLVCCDGAAVAALDHGVMPTWVIGDGDSLPAEYRERLAPQLGNHMRFLDDQSINDLTKSTRLLRNHVPTPRPFDGDIRFAYVGATGKREDHTLGNISLMYYYASYFGIEPTLITDHGYFVVAKGCNHFETFAGQQVSVFNINCKELHSQRLRWPIEAFEMAWQGTLNEAQSSLACIDGDGWYMVYRTFEGKKRSIV